MKGFRLQLFIMGFSIGLLIGPFLPNQSNQSNQSNQQIKYFAFIVR